MKYIIHIILLLILVSCNAARDAGNIIRNEKSNTSDEFFIKKREPLTVPPRGAQLPIPKSTKKTEYKKNKSIEDILNTKVESSSKTKTNSTNEKSILNRIKR